MQELWLVDYKKDAYTDHTGASHWGKVVHARTVVVSTAETFPIETGYNVRGEETAGKIYIRPTGIDDEWLTGDEFRYYPELVDYAGSGTWRNVTNPDEQGKERGWWQRPPLNPKGYVYPDGSGPVRKVLE